MKLLNHRDGSLIEINHRTVPFIAKMLGIFTNFIHPKIVLNQSAFSDKMDNDEL